MEAAAAVAAFLEPKGLHSSSRPAESGLYRWSKGAVAPELVWRPSLLLAGAPRNATLGQRW